MTRAEPAGADASRTRLPAAVTLLVGGAAAVIVAAGLHAVAWLAGPVALAFVVVVTVRPVEEWLRRRGLPRWAATVVLIVAVFAVVLALAGVVVVSLARLATVLPGYRTEAGALVGGLAEPLRDLGVGAVPVSEIVASLDLGRVAGIVGGLLAGAAGLAGNLVFLFSLLLFLSIESGGFSRRFAALERVRPDTAAALTGFTVDVRRFLLVTTVFGLLTAAVDTVFLVAVGVPLAVLWGLLAFITNYIPYIGFFVGVVPPAVLALLEGGYVRALLVVGVYVVVNFVLCSLVQPRFIGDAVGLSLTVVLVSLGFWAWLLGPLGAVLAIPLTLLVKALLVDADPRAGWVSALLGAPEAASPGRPAPASTEPPATDPPTTDPPAAGPPTAGPSPA